MSPVSPKIFLKVEHVWSSQIWNWQNFFPKFVVFACTNTLYIAYPLPLPSSPLTQHNNHYLWLNLQRWHPSYVPSSLFHSSFFLSFLLQPMHNFLPTSMIKLVLIFKPLSEMQWSKPSMEKPGLEPLYSDCSSTTVSSM